MGLTVTTPAKSELLTTVPRVKAEMGITVSTYDELLLTLIRQASAAVRTFCHRYFARQAYSESAPAYGGPYLLTREAPIVSLGTVSYRGEALTDVSVEDAIRGELYRQAGFDWSAQRYAGLLAGGWSLDQGSPIPLSEEPLVSMAYTAGYLVPAQDLLSAPSVSVDATDDSFNDSASGFPTLLKAGDVIETLGFATAANNGRFLVTGTPTTAKIVVSADLTTEAAGAGAAVLVSNLPADVERGCIETVKSYYAQRATDSSIVEKQAGLMRIRYAEDRDEELGIPPMAAGLLRPWVRRAA